MFDFSTKGGRILYHRSRIKTRKQRQEEARERQNAYNMLTTEQKIIQASNRRGNSERELNRLQGI